MWELRHPIDVGPIFEGRELGRVLRSHASTFSTITSIRTNLVQSGREPRLPTITRGLLFSIAHDAMTNACRHARAGKVTIVLAFESDRLRMTLQASQCANSLGRLHPRPADHPRPRESGQGAS